MIHICGTRGRWINRWRVTIWTNDGLIYWHIYAPSDLNGLTHTTSKNTCTINTLRPDDEHRHHSARSSLVQVLAWCLFGTKPFPESMINYQFEANSVIGHRSYQRANSQEISTIFIFAMNLKMTNLRLQLHLCGANELSHQIQYMPRIMFTGSCFETISCKLLLFNVTMLILWGYFTGIIASVPVKWSWAIWIFWELRKNKANLRDLIAATGLLISILT